MSDTELPTASMKQVLASLRKRQRLLCIVQGCGQGLFYGGVAAVALALAAAALPDLMSLPSWVAVLCIPALGAVGAFIGLIRRVETLRVARALDRAASSQDRFASALQLSSHRRQARARLIVDDALSAVQPVPVQSALPFRAPRELKWFPIPVLVLAVLFWLGPSRSIEARTIEEPEVTAEEWVEIHRDFQRQIDDLPEPKTLDEKELVDQLKKLASALREQPAKKEALARIAKLQEQLRQSRQGLSGRNFSLRQAAQSVRSSTLLSQFGSALERGNYQKAAEQLESLSKQLSENTRRMTATDFESAASDFDRLAMELAQHEQLNSACRNCANAAGSMNRNRLSDALSRFAKRLRENASGLKRCDGICRSMNLLDELRRRLNRRKECSSCKNGQCSQCKSCGNGQCRGCGSGSGFVRRSNKKGGLKAGWGTADSWRGGGIAPQREQRLPDLTDAREQAGESTTYSVVSEKERARSMMDYKDIYSEMVHMAEADLSLETVPIAYREYLRRYFLSIRPRDKIDSGE